MRLTYEIASVGDAQLKRVLRSIEAEATSQARRGYIRDQRAARLRVTTARGAVRSEAAIEREHSRQQARVRANDHRLRMADLAARERAIKRETAELRKQNHEIDKQIRASKRRSAEMVKDAKRAQALRERTAGRVMAGAGRVVGGTAGVLGAGLRTIGGIAAIGGTIAAGNAVSTQMSEQARASMLANQAGTPELKGQLLKEAQGVKGFSGMEILDAMGQFADVTGDLDMARAAMGEFAQLALATGTSLEDLAAAAGNAFIPISDKIQDPKERLEELLSTMRAIAGQGSIGAVEIKDLAAEMAGLAAATNKFKGGPSDLIKTVGAMAQAARQRGGASTSAEAVTSVSRFVDDVVKNSGDFSKMGLNVFADKGKTQLKDPQEIITEMLKKTGGDLTKVGDLFGIYAQRAVAGFSPLYTQAEAKQKGSGEKAVQAEFARLLAAEMTKEQMAERADSRLADSDLQFKEAIKNFNSAMGEQLLPKLTELIPRFAELTPVVADLAEKGIKMAEWLADNPFAGLGMLVGGMIVKEVAAAGIGSLLSSAVASSLAAAGVGTAAAGAGAGTAAAGAGAGALGARLAGAGKWAMGGIRAAGAGIAGAATSAGGAIGAGLTAAGAKVAGAGVLGVGALGAAAVGSTALAGYQGYKLNKELEGEGQGGMMANLIALMQRSARQNAEADRIFEEIARRNAEAAEQLNQAAQNLGGATAVNRTNPMSKRGP